MDIQGILGLIGTIAGLGASILFGLLAWRGRGEAIAAQKITNATNDAKLEAERRADTADRAKLDADTLAAAAHIELDVVKGELERVRGELAAEHAAKEKLYARLAEAGVSVGDIVVDGAIDGLFTDPNR